MGRLPMQTWLMMMVRLCGCCAKWGYLRDSKKYTETSHVPQNHSYLQNLFCFCTFCHFTHITQFEVTELALHLNANAECTCSSQSLYIAGRKKYTHSAGRRQPTCIVKLLHNHTLDEAHSAREGPTSACFDLNRLRGFTYFCNQIAFTIRQSAVTFESFSRYPLRLGSSNSQHYIISSTYCTSA
jgi:hypothetical protein